MMIDLTDKPKETYLIWLHLFYDCLCLFLSQS